MRARTFLWALAVAITSSAAAQGLSADHLIVPSVSIGAAELEEADQGALSRELGEPTQKDRHGDHAYYRYGPDADPNALVVDFDLANDAPFEIWTDSSAYRTREGLGVDSAEQEIRAVLGKPLCESHRERDGLLVYDAIWFATRDGRATRVSIRKHMSPSDFRTGPLHC